jgi:hypothetical protein
MAKGKSALTWRRSLSKNALNDRAHPEGPAVVTDTSGRFAPRVAFSGGWQKANEAVGRA